MTARARPEDAIQSAILSYLAAVISPKVGFAYANPMASRRTASGRASNAVPGLMRGIPDLTIIAAGGRAYYVEVKTAKGVLSDAQQLVLSRFATMGVPYVVARGIDDMRAALIQWGFDTREVMP